MSKVLIIRHLPTTLSFKEKEQLLKHFGADKVWESSKRRHYVFASFATVEKAKSSLSRLHQLQIGRRRLVVEYSEEEPVKGAETDNEETSATTKIVNEFLKVLNAWNPSVDFYQPPPAHLKYKYPDLTPDIAINIIHALFTHKPFYVQSLHLMNKICLGTPFTENEASVKFFKDTFLQYFLSEVPIPAEQESEIESEVSSDETEKKTKVAPLFKRKRKLAAPVKRPGTVLPTATLPKVKKVANPSQEKVFEAVKPVQEKKISVIVHQDALQKPSSQPEVIGELGKFEKEVQPETVEETPVPEQPVITRKELLHNRISYSDMKVLPVFANYHPGQPSMRLYIKNLAKTVTEQDLSRIFKRYVADIPEEELVGFDIRLMQEGRMKGQAFVNFPSVSLAEKALHETNGYLLKEKPMVVQFARAAIKKSLD